MRCRCLVMALLLLCAATARAGTLTSASWITDLDLGPGVPLPSFGLPVTASGTSTANSIAVSLGVPQFTTQFLVPKNPLQPNLDLFVTVTQAGAQLITATPGMAAGTVGIPGTALVMTGGHVNMGANASMIEVGMVTLVHVPLSVGVNGQHVAPRFSILGAYHYLTGDFYAWTPGTRTFTGLTSNYAPLPDVIAMGSFALTAMGGGTVTLVSPSKLSIDGSLAQRRTVSLTTLRLSFVPEPSTLLLLVAAVVGGLALVRKQREH